MADQPDKKKRKTVDENSEPTEAISRSQLEILRKAMETAGESAQADSADGQVLIEENDEDVRDPVLQELSGYLLELVLKAPERTDLDRLVFVNRAFRDVIEGGGKRLDQCRIIEVGEDETEETLLVTQVNSGKTIKFNNSTKDEIHGVFKHSVLEGSVDKYLTFYSSLDVSEEQIKIWHELAKHRVPVDKMITSSPENDDLPLDELVRFREIVRHHLATKEVMVLTDHVMLGDRNLWSLFDFGLSTDVMVTVRRRELESKISNNDLAELISGSFLKYPRLKELCLVGRDQGLLMRGLSTFIKVFHASGDSMTMFKGLEIGPIDEKEATIKWLTEKGFKPTEEQSNKLRMVHRKWKWALNAEFDDSDVDDLRLVIKVIDLLDEEDSDEE